VHNKSKWKVNETYLERKWRPSERSSSWARGGSRWKRRLAEEERKERKAEARSDSRREEGMF